MINNKYKTVMCKHFEQTGQCYMGAKCHFAHGNEELRGMNDPLPSSPIPSNTPSRQPGNFPRQQDASAGSGNYKTVKCRFFEKGLCKHNQNCSFAHGDDELRQSKGYSGSQSGGPSGMSLQNMMPPMYDPNLQNQVAFQQIQLLANEMKEYHGKDKELSAQVSQAVEMNQSGNIQGAAAILYGLMDRPGKTQQDTETYGTFQSKMQQLGSSMYQSYQMQQYSQQMASPQMEYSPMGGYGGMGGYNQGYSGQRYQKNQEYNNGSYQGQDGNKGSSQQNSQYGTMNNYNNYGGHQGQYGSHPDNQGQY